jgi:hypothetical protein
VSEKPGHLGNPKAQNKLRAQEGEYFALADADAELLLRTDWGRRIAMRLVYSLLRLDSLSFEPNAGVKDGIAMALLSARFDGLREGAHLLGVQFRRVNPELWLLAHSEKWADDAKAGERRAEAESTPADEG